MEQPLQEELSYVEHYLKTYFDEMLINDIKMLQEQNLRFTLPYIHLVCAGIDFLGGLETGFYKVNSEGRFVSNSRVRSLYFIKEWMGRVSSLYREEGMGDFIYSSVRCGIVHQVIFKEGIESYKGDDYREKHLYVRVNPEGKERIFIHALQFADDFIEAHRIFREEFLVEKNIHDVYERLHGLQKNKDGNALTLIKNLKDKKYMFREEISPSPSAPAK